MKVLELDFRESRSGVEVIRGQPLMVKILFGALMIVSLLRVWNPLNWTRLLCDIWCYAPQV